MEHLESPSDPVYELLKVPCLSSEAYDGGQFLTYPSRRGWNDRRLFIGDFMEHDPATTATFLQDWLYFGVLVEVLGEDATKSAFTDTGFVSTVHLEELIYKRLWHIRELIRQNDKRYRSMIRRAELCLRHVSYYCCLASADEHATIHWPLTEELDLSIRLLGQRLNGAYIAGLASIGSAEGSIISGSILWQLRWPASVLLSNRLVEQGWCSSDVTRIIEEFSPSSIYYISLLRHPATSKDHKGCTSRKCFAFQVDASTYQTKHVTDDCTCAFIGPDIGKIVDTIKAGKIPLLSIETKQDGLQISVEAQIPEKSQWPEQNYSIRSIRLLGASKDYVAISHVWADGLGNPKHNELPMCQLKRLKNILDELRDQNGVLELLNMGKMDALLRKARNTSLRFWLDTLCVPVDTNLTDIRREAIQKMKDVYNESRQVIVLDEDLQDVSLSKIDSTEMFMRISLSGWMRRLWTLHEGVLGGKLYVKFNDNIIDVQKMYTAEVELSHHRTLTKEQDLTRSLVVVKGNPRCDSSEFVWRMRSMRAHLFPPNDRKAIGFIQYNTVSEERTTAMRRMHGIMTAFDAARFRTTSRAEDVYICMGNLLGWASSDIGAVAPEGRLRKMLEEQSTLPQGIVFVPGPRNHELGWRWAVTTFDNDHHTAMKVNIQDDDPGVRSAEGFTVIYPGLILPNEASDMILSKEIIIADLVNQQKRWWHVIVHGSLSFSNGTLCVLYFAPSVKGIPHQFVLMAAIVISIRTSTVDDIQHIERPIYGRFEALATVQIVGSSYESELFMQRADHHARRVELSASTVKRAWTIQ